MSENDNRQARKPDGQSAKKSRKKSESQSPESQPSPKAAKRRRVVAGLLEGKSMRKAATDAGFTESMADNFKQKILPGVQEEFRDELGKSVPHASLIKRLVEGLSAFETKWAQQEGKFTDSKHLVAWTERRRYAELIAKLLGHLVERVEIGGPDKGPLNFSLNVKFRDK